MTIAECIERVDALKPNRFGEDVKLEWLRNVEGQIYQEVVLTHENPDEIEMTDFEDEDNKLIAPFPYDEVYVLYLQSQIDYGNMEIAKYNNSKTLFNNAYLTLRDHWNRKYMPIPVVRRYNNG